MILNKMSIICQSVQIVKLKKKLMNLLLEKIEKRVTSLFRNDV